MPICNLLKYSSDYSGKTGSSWFSSKDETANFNADNTENNAFNSFKYKGKLLGNTEADAANGILKNTTVTVPWKYLSSFWRSL